jgi:hypothetical protein
VSLDDLAARLRSVAKRGDGQHAHHEMPYYDPEDGVVCACGHKFGVRFEDLDEELGNPATAVDAAEAVAEGAQAGALQIAAPDEEQESRLVKAGRELVQREVNPIVARVDLIDPTLPYGPKEVEQHILDATARLERGIVFEAALIASTHEATMVYTMAFSRALARQSGGDAEWRKARAIGEVEPQYEAMMRATMARDAMKATLHSLRSVLSSYQSVAKSVAANYGAAEQVSRAQNNKAGGYF